MALTVGPKLLSGFVTFVPSPGWVGMTCRESVNPKNVAFPPLPKRVALTVGPKLLSGFLTFAPSPGRFGMTCRESVNPKNVAFPPLPKCVVLTKRVQSHGDVNR